MALHPETRFPSPLSYLLKLRNDATPDVLVGRLENLVTGRRRDFRSAGELIDALVREIDASVAEPGNE